MEIILNVYDDDFVTVKKTCKAKIVKIPFGVVRKLMKVLNVDTLEDTTQILNIVSSSWTTVTGLLDRIFPDMTEDDWDYVDMKELVQVVYAIVKAAFTDMLSIPTDPKN